MYGENNKEREIEESSDERKKKERNETRAVLGIAFLPLRVDEVESSLRHAPAQRRGRGHRATKRAVAALRLAARAAATAPGCNRFAGCDRLLLLLMEERGIGERAEAFERNHDTPDEHTITTVLGRHVSVAAAVRR